MSAGGAKAAVGPPARRRRGEVRSTVKARLVERAFQVVFELADQPEGARLSALSRKAGLSRATTLRILRTLNDIAVVDFDEDRRLYRLGPAACRLGAAAIEQGQLARVAQPLLEHLQRETGETVSLFRRRGAERICIAAVQSTHEIRHIMEVGLRRPLLRGAAGRVLMAYLSPEELETLLAPVPPAARRTLLEGCRRLRSAGAIVTRGEVVDGGTAIAAPVLGPDRRPVAALAVVGPSARLDHEVLRRVMALVIETAEALSTRLLGRSAEPAEAGRR